MGVQNNKAFVNSPLPFVQKISIEEIGIITVQTFAQTVFNMSVKH